MERKAWSDVNLPMDAVLVVATAQTLSIRQSQEDPACSMLCEQTSEANQCQTKMDLERRNIPRPGAGPESIREAKVLEVMGVKREDWGTGEPHAPSTRAPAVSLSLPRVIAPFHLRRSLRKAHGSKWVRVLMIGPGVKAS